MGHDGFHCGAPTWSLRVRPDILSSIGRMPLWRKLNSAFWQCPVPPLWPAEFPPRAGEVRAGASPHPAATFGVPGTGDVPLPQSDVHFVIFE